MSLLTSNSDVKERSRECLLPANATDRERALEGAIRRASQVPTKDLKTLWDPETCPEDILPWLAWSLAIQTWDSSWSVNRKREAIAESIGIYRKQGTIGALRSALALLDITFDIEEQSDGPFTFSVKVKTPDYLTADRLKMIGEVIENNKNLRSHVYSIVSEIGVKNSIHWVATTMEESDLTIYPLAEDSVDLLMEVPMLLGAMIQVVQYSTVNK